MDCGPRNEAGDSIIEETRQANQGEVKKPPRSQGEGDGHAVRRAWAMSAIRTSREVRDGQPNANADSRVSMTRSEKTCLP